MESIEIFAFVIAYAIPQDGTVGLIAYYIAGLLNK